MSDPNGPRVSPWRRERGRDREELNTVEPIRHSGGGERDLLAISASDAEYKRYRWQAAGHTTPRAFLFFCNPEAGCTVGCRRRIFPWDRQSERERLRSGWDRVLWSWSSRKMTVLETRTDMNPQKKRKKTGSSNRPGKDATTRWSQIDYTHNTQCASSPLQNLTV